MSRGTLVTLWTIRASAVLYVLAVAALILRSDRVARLAWTAGCILCLMHTAAAFQFYHAWSHAHAYQATARAVAAKFGVSCAGLASPRLPSWPRLPLIHSGHGE